MKTLSQITTCFYLRFTFMSVNIYGSSVSFPIHTKNRDASNLYAAERKKAAWQKFKTINDDFEQQIDGLCS